ncbi:MAG TPA: hypothetical protein VMV73_06440 [Candidatus Dormibacteraeota bacterium]|nr:hypothetical protein [Candidatus Dormibacteraeota bacterium]
MQPIHLLALMLAFAPQQGTTGATAPPLAPLAPLPSETLNNGGCLDSPRPVPMVLMPPVVRGEQIVRIDKVVSTASMMPGEVIGFLYTLEDGTIWLGQRTPDYMSAADSRALNLVLGAAHLPADTVTTFPPQMRYGVATHYQQFFRVQLTDSALSALHVRIDPCVAWPSGRDLPDPSL